THLDPKQGAGRRRRQFAVERSGSDGATLTGDEVCRASQTIRAIPPPRRRGTTGLWSSLTHRVPPRNSRWITSYPARVDTQRPSRRAADTRDRGRPNLDLRCCADGRRGERLLTSRRAPTSDAEATPRMPYAAQ